MLGLFHLLDLFATDKEAETFLIRACQELFHGEEPRGPLLPEGPSPARPPRPLPSLRRPPFAASSQPKAGLGTSSRRGLPFGCCPSHG